MVLLSWCRSFIVVDGMLAKGGASAANQKYLTCHLLSDLLPCFVFNVLHILTKQYLWLPFDSNCFLSEVVYFQLT